MKKILLSFLLTATACFLLSLPLAGQEPLYRPRLTNDKNQSHHDFPMGVLSATGRLADGERAILVKDVGAEGAAAAGGLPGHPGAPKDANPFARGRRGGEEPGAGLFYTLSWALKDVGPTGPGPGPF